MVLGMSSAGLTWRLMLNFLIRSDIRNCDSETFWIKLLTKWASLARAATSPTHSWCV